MNNTITRLHFSRDELLRDFWGSITKSIARFPDKEFIVTPEGHLTYRDADRQANSISSALSKKNLGDGFGVGLFLKDNLKFIPAMLGGIKSHNYVVPLDVTFPEVTIKQMVEAASIRVILTDGTHLPLIRAMIGPETVVMNLDEIDLDAGAEYPLAQYGPDDWVQILFTSGSTGEPKGAIETYRYLAYAAYLKATAFQYEYSDRLLQLSSFTFAGQHTHLFGALMTGMTLCYYNVREDGFVGLADWMRQEKITIYNSTATVFRSLTSVLRQGEQFPSVRLVHLGGEKMFAADLEAFKRYFPNLQSVRFGFASTETQSVALNILPADYKFDTEILPAGRPTEGVKILIWDEAGRELPKGEEGEIVIHSDTMASGYVGNPVLTRQRFIPDLNNPGFQFFRTGDAGKLLPDGQLVHLGRIDRMVKLKGVRIEPDSIESQIMAYPGILQAACNVFEDRRGSKKLAAYFTTEPGIQIPVSDLRDFLRVRLPAALIPHYFMHLENLPRTHTNKIDRGQLPLPNLQRPVLPNPYIPAANELEAALVKIWEEEIGIEGIGVTDDFFDVGGDSLIGVTLFIRIEQDLGKDLPVSVLVKASTIRKQAEIIRDERTSRDFSPVIAIHPEGSSAPLFFVPGKGGYPTRIRHLAGKIHRDTPIFALQDLSIQQHRRPLRSIEAMAAFYLNELRKVAPRGPYVLMGESMGGKVAYEMACQLVKAGEQVPILVLLDTYLTDSPFEESGWSYYRMILKKHWTVLRTSGPQGRLDYLKFYRETLFQKLTGYIRQRDASKQKRRESGRFEEITRIRESNLTASSRYRPGSYPGRVILLKALRGSLRDQPANGWDQVQTGELVIHPIDCYHGSILFEPAVSGLAEIMNQYLSPNKKPIST